MSVVGIGEVAASFVERSIRVTPDAASCLN
jgi:hypothetical protein